MNATTVLRRDVVCRSLLSRIDRESSGMVSAEQFLEIFSAKWMEADSEEIQVFDGLLLIA